MPSPGDGAKTERPAPPMVTSFFTRSGCAIANCVPTMPPIEFPMIDTRSRPSPSRKSVTATEAIAIGCPSHGSLTPKPGNSRTRHR